MVADSEELENLDVSQIHARRLKCQRGPRAENAELFICPIADGPVKINCLCEIRFSGDPSQNQDHPARGEEHNDVLRGRVACHPSDTLDDGEAETIFWTIAGNCFCRHLCRKENHSQIHCDFFDVGKDNKYYLGRVAGKPY